MCAQHDYAHLGVSVAEATSEAPTPTTARHAGLRADPLRSSGDGIGWVDLVCLILGHIPETPCLLIPECWQCSRCDRHTRRLS